MNAGSPVVTPDWVARKLPFTSSRFRCVAGPQISPDLTFTLGGRLWRMLAGSIGLVANFHCYPMLPLKWIVNPDWCCLIAQRPVA